MSRLGGIWYNQHGSVLELEPLPDGKLVGKFRSGIGLAASGNGCDVVGYATGDLVTFVVNFGAFDSLASWTGHSVTHDGELVLRLMWHMAVAPPGSKRERDLWKGLWTGTDVFTREKSAAAPPSWRPSHPIPDWP